MEMRIVAIPNEALCAPGGHAFNCSIVEFQGRLHLFYRYTFGTSGATKIARCELNDNLMPLPGTTRFLDVPKLTREWRQSTIRAFSQSATG
jgi:hypothetical protein